MSKRKHRAPSILAEAAENRGARSYHPRHGPVVLRDGKLYSERDGSLIYDYGKSPDRISGQDETESDINPGDDGGEG